MPSLQENALGPPTRIEAVKAQSFCLDDWTGLPANQVLIKAHNVIILHLSFLKCFHICCILWSSWQPLRLVGLFQMKKNPEVQVHWLFLEAQWSVLEEAKPTLLIPHQLEVPVPGIAQHTFPNSNTIHKTQTLRSSQPWFMTSYVSLLKCVMKYAKAWS